MRVLVTGATGRTGQAIVPALARRGHAVSYLTRRPQATPPPALAAAEPRGGDLADAAALADALRGVAAVYHIPPNMSADEVPFGERLIAAARAAGVGHFVYHSVLHPQLQGLEHHWRKLFVEEALLESGLGFTILQPASYMQNTLQDWAGITGEGIHTMAFSITARLNLVDLEDVAEVAARVVGEAAHHGAIYELAGPEALSVEDKARILSDVLGRPVAARQQTPAGFRERAHAAGMPAHVIEGRLRMFAHYSDQGLTGNPNVLGWLLGRAPTRFADFARRAAQAGRA